ncbi:MAG: flavin reductase [Rhodothermales bacterium]|nr:flavin reductase [Rhodothermales bacterium]
MEDFNNPESIVEIDTDKPIWDRFFTVAPLVLVGTTEPDGRSDFAPKHMAMPMGWNNMFGFVCTPKHATYRNADRSGYFTVSFPRPSQVVLSSLASSPRCDDNTKAVLQAFPTLPAKKIPGEYVANSYLYLGCSLDRIVDGFGDNSLMVGIVEEAFVARKSLRISESDDLEMIANEPLLAFLAYGYYTEIEKAKAFPLPEGFSR